MSSFTVPEILISGRNVRKKEKNRSTLVPCCYGKLQENIPTFRRA
jgi:hypothetical protein